MTELRKTVNVWRDINGMCPVEEIKTPELFTLCLEKYASALLYPNSKSMHEFSFEYISELKTRFPELKEQLKEQL